MKLLLLIILTTSLFAQDKSNQISYTIETTTEYYNNVSIDSVYDLRVELYDKLLNTKLDIPIAEIKSLKNGDRDQIYLAQLLVPQLGQVAVQLLHFMR